MSVNVANSFHVHICTSMNSFFLIQVCVTHSLMPLQSPLHSKSSIMILACFIALCASLTVVLTTLCKELSARRA
ncbi:hypothetical protein BCR44DRAFT_1425932 [Catenaria anguillulae PL171]|uniref:Uncharacterized protein n=1 Tax=Catenaria anguillulae PL171 TaxID=765915 RepID=A0A1Y2HZD6_9FUNG|nr:hypothetical protein BCR44DRAFT_1425932 [Catenaria anguillulae PL171]